MSDRYPIIEVDPSELHSAGYQPASRTALNGALNSLQRSIKTEGLQYPPLVVRNANGDGYTVVDGHRRIRVAKELKWPKIPVIVSSQGDASKLFAAVSGASKPLTAVEWIHVYLNGGSLPPSPTAACIKKLDLTMGRAFLQELADKSLSPAVWNFATKLLKYLGLQEDRKPDMLRWLTKYKLSQSAHAAIQMETSPSTILHAFEADRDSI